MGDTTIVNNLDTASCETRISCSPAQKLSIVVLINKSSSNLFLLPAYFIGIGECGRADC